MIFLMYYNDRYTLIEQSPMGHPALANYRIAGFDCKQKILQMSFLGHRRIAGGFYIYEYLVCIELFHARVHVFGVIDVTTQKMYLSIVCTCVKCIAYTICMIL